MTDTVALRLAEVSDAAAISALSSVLGYALPPEPTAELVQRMRSDARYTVWVAQAPCGALWGWIVGERRYTLESGESHEITGLVVHPDARRRGVGARLVAQVRDWASTHGARSLRVRSNVQREASHHFYPALGFSAHKTQQVYVLQWVVEDARTGEVRP